MAFAGIQLRGHSSGQPSGYSGGHVPSPGANGGASSPKSHAGREHCDPPTPRDGESARIGPGPCDFEEIEPELFRFPAINPANLRRRVEEAFASGI